jgi:predicted hydrocarbon binding protein
MSRTHATGSAITYGKRYLKDMIFNLSFLEKDDDGNAAGGVTQDAGADWVSKIQEATTPQEAMNFWTAATNVAKAACNGEPDYKAMTIFTDARDARLKALKKVSK